MRMNIVLFAALLAGSVESAAQESVIHASYEEVQYSVDGEVMSTESGDYFFGADGRQRHDRRPAGRDATSEIVNPDEGERVVLNHTAGLAARGPVGMRISMPGHAALRSGDRPFFGGHQVEPPRGATIAESESLGFQARGPVMLQGHMFRTPAIETANVYIPALVVEEWTYKHHSSIVSEVLESSATAMVDGEAVLVGSRRLTSISRTVVPNGVFEPSLTEFNRVENLWNDGPGQGRR